MDGQEFKVRGPQMVDYIIEYLEVRSISTKVRVLSIFTCRT